MPQKTDQKTALKKRHSDGVKQALERAWALRFQQKNSEAERTLESIEKQVTTQEQDWQIRLLRASLLRSRGQLAKSNKVLDEVGTEMFAKSHRADFTYYFQKALNVFSVDDFSVALEFFLLAQSVTTQSSEKLLCLMNILTCLENLNLPLGATLTEIEVLLKNSKDKAKHAPVEAQLSAFRLRDSFRSGRTREIFSSRLSNEVDQSHYYRLWVSRLPFVDAPTSFFFSPTLEQVARASDLHDKAYRLKTVMADPRIQETVSKDHVTQTAQQVDRIYLWTWLWLTNPSEVNRQLLIEILTSFDFRAALNKMTFEDFQMLQNSLSWIALFQKRIAPEIESYLAHFSVQNFAPFPLFEYENLCIRYLRALSRGQKAEFELNQVQQHPLHDSKDLKIAAVVEALENVIAQMTQSTPATLKSIFIDEDTHRIFKGRQITVSEPLSKVMAALSDLRVLKFSEILWIGYGIAPYESAIHQAKIHNLLARMKAILPKSVSLKSKDEMVYWQGPTDAVVRLAAPLLAKPLLEHVSGLRLNAAPASEKRVFSRPLHPRAVVERANGRQSLCREEFQELMNVSRASAGRWLKKWMAQGLIRADGRGRSTIYHIEITDYHRLNPII